MYSSRPCFLLSRIKAFKFNHAAAAAAAAAGGSKGQSNDRTFDPPIHLHTFESYLFRAIQIPKHIGFCVASFSPIARLAYL